MSKDDLFWLLVCVVIFVFAIDFDAGCGVLIGMIICYIYDKLPAKNKKASAAEEPNSDTKDIPE